MMYMYIDDEGDLEREYSVLLKQKGKLALKLKKKKNKKKRAELEIKRGENNLRRVQSHSGPTQLFILY